MKILFTGGSSFSGMWFVKQLAEAGHAIFATFQKEENQYCGIRLRRVKQVCEWATPIWRCSFGSDSFLQNLKNESFDLLCHHGAEVRGYKNPSFDVEAAVSNNTHHLEAVFSLLRKTRCTLLLTGTVFEPEEGMGDSPLDAVSPYGLSKGITSDLFLRASEKYEVPLRKFIIANPFGPFEEGRFTTYLAQQWLEGKIPSVDYPDYIRDNVPVSLLAIAYAHFITDDTTTRLCPKGYTEKQGSFTKRFASELASRLNIPCPLEIKKQTQFVEPKTRTATDELDWHALNWDEEKSWDELAEYYAKTYGSSSR